MIGEVVRLHDPDLSGPPPTGMLLALPEGFGVGLRFEDGRIAALPFDPDTSQLECVDEIEAGSMFDAMRKDCEAAGMIVADDRIKYGPMPKRGSPEWKDARRLSAFVDANY